jgi:uncharacterized protein (TIGR03083 family)
VEPAEYLDAIRSEASALAALVDDHLAVEVPSCPGWDVEKLAGHLGRVHRWVTAMVRSRAAERLDFPGRPDHVDGEWLVEGVTELTAALEEAGPDVAMFTFPHGGGTSRFWFRRQAEETAVHRWDGEHAVRPGQAAAIDTEVALAGVDELLDVLFAGRPIELGGTLHLHASDSPHGEWNVTLDDDRTLLVGHGHEDGAAATVTGTASDLLLWLWGRPVAADRIAVAGDGGVVDQWRSAFSLP